MGFHLIPNDLSIDFVGIRRISYIVSVVLILAGVASMIVKGGPRYGIDFAGGAVVQIKLEKPVDDETIKKNLEGADLPGLVVQSFGDDNTSYLIRVSSTESDTSEKIRNLVAGTLAEKLAGNKVEIQRLEMVGPKVGADLRAKAMEAMYFATLLIAIYVSGRFEQRWMAAVIMAAVLGGGMYALEWLGAPKVILVLAATVLTIVMCWRLKLVFALGAIVSILHDVLITIGLFSIMDKEFDLTIIAALLTIVGYSLNDTIIVYDRIRENLHGNKVNPLSVIINRSINQTLSRTVLTSGTTLLVISSLLVWGGGIIHDFALVMFIGVFVGTASSMFVASPVLLAFGDTVMSRAAEDDEKARQAALRKRRTAQV